jgi:hypothetical protein
VCVFYKLARVAPLRAAISRQSWTALIIPSTRRSRRNGATQSSACKTQGMPKTSASNNRSATTTLKRILTTIRMSASMCMDVA